MAGLLDYIAEFGKGVPQGVNQVGAGIAQLGINGLNKIGLMGPDAIKRNQQIIAQQSADMEKNSGLAGKLGQAVGNFIPTLAVPGLPIGGAVGKMATGVLNGALGDALLPTTPGGPSRLQNIATGARNGAVAGALGIGAGKVIGAIGPKGINRLGNVLRKESEPSKEVDTFTPTQGVTQGFIEKMQEGGSEAANPSAPHGRLHPASMMLNQLPAGQRQQALGIANILDHAGQQAGQQLVAGLMNHPNGAQFLAAAGMVQPGSDAMNQLTGQAANALRTQQLFG